MTADELHLLVKSLVPGVHAVVTKAIAGVTERLAALEARVVSVKDGAVGPVGPQGPAGADAAPVTRQQLVDSIREALTVGDGTFVSAIDLKGMVREAVSEHLKAHPPADGKDGRDGIDGVGKDGLGLAGAVITREGTLVITLTDGQTRDLGVVVGKDGAPGVAGRDGLDGVNGADGLGFGDLHMEQLDERTVAFRATRGDQAKEIGTLSVPALIYRGVFREGTTYSVGDSVTWAGALWVARAVTTDKPGEGATAWQLAVKKGADGKTGPQGPQGPQGGRGEKGDPGPRVY